MFNKAIKKTYTFIDSTSFPKSVFRTSFIRDLRDKRQLKVQKMFSVCIYLNSFKTMRKHFKSHHFANFFESLQPFVFVRF